MNAERTRLTLADEPLLVQIRLSHDEAVDLIDKINQVQAGLDLGRRELRPPYASPARERTLTRGEVRQ
mgnify:CR=1 FL=1